MELRIKDEQLLVGRHDKMSKPNLEELIKIKEVVEKNIESVKGGLS